MVPDSARRKPSATFTEERTYCPSRKRRLAGGLFELLHVPLPSAGFIVVTATVITTKLAFWDRLSRQTRLPPNSGPVTTDWFRAVLPEKAGVSPARRLRSQAEQGDIQR